jgi:aminoglycoside phosphotransferase (APT) family kinase protein
MMTRDATHTEIGCVLRLAFGRDVPRTPIPVPEGQSERTMAFALHGGRSVPERVFLLRYPPRHWDRALRAFTALTALDEQHFPVPAVYYLGWSHHTRYALMLMEYVDGRGDEGMAHAFFVRVGTHFAQTLARLHRLTWDPLPDLPVLPLRLSLFELGERVCVLGTPELCTIYDWLAERVDGVTEQAHTLLHGDYTLHSVLAEGTQVIAVQGWEHATLGDPRLDVGTTSATLGAYGTAFSDQFLDAYQAAAGPIEDCVFWEVFGALCLLAGIAGRVAALTTVDWRAVRREVGPAWEGLLKFVEARTGLEL